MAFLRTTLRIVDLNVRADGEWYCAPDDKARLAHVRKVLAEYQEAEPARGWKLQCRGTANDWHDWNPQT